MRLALIMTALFSLICACTNTPQRNVVIQPSEVRQQQVVQLVKEFPAFAVAAIEKTPMTSETPTLSEKGGSCSTVEALEAMPELSLDQGIEMAQFPVEYHAPVHQSLIL